MATVKRKRKASGERSLVPLADKHVVNETLRSFGKRNMTTYAIAVNLDRSVPDLFDGMKPVQRRIAWTMSQMGAGLLKSGEVVGAVLGKYHPHGDLAIYGAMQTMVHLPTPAVYGEGGWGNITDGAAAYRYCFVGSTRVTTERGLIPIKELCESTEHLAVRGDYQLNNPVRVESGKKSNLATYFVNSGKQDTVRVTTARGFNATCTPNEPFLVLTPEGHRWKEAQELTSGDWLCVKRNQDVVKEIPSGHSINDKYQASTELASVLGYLVGDGFMNEGQNYVGFCQVDKKVMRNFVSCFSKAFPDYKFSVNTRNANSYGKEKCEFFNCNSVALRSDLVDLGLPVGNSYNRVVPEPVFRMSRKEVAMFLRALFETDGSAAIPNRGSSIVCLHSVSEELLLQVKLLLLTYFGIVASMPVSDGKAGCSTALRINITGAENIRRFKKRIGFFSKRKTENLYVAEGERGNLDMIPYANYLGLSRRKTYFQTRRADFRRNAQDGNLFLGKVAKSIYNKDYYYDRVVSVEEAGEEIVYDLTVKKEHSFVANGLIVHNTNCMLTGYGKSFFDADYNNNDVISFVPNYNDKYVEPVTLPAQLPNVLLNGGEGIGVGITTHLPTFTPESMINVLERLLKGEKLQALDFAKTMKFAHKWGGVMTVTKENKAQWLLLFKGSAANVQFESEMDVDRDGKRITISDWPPGTNLEKFVQKVRAMAECQRCINSKGSSTFTIECKPTYNFVQFDKFVEKVRKATMQRRAFKINVTRRQAQTVDGVTTFRTDFLALSVPQLIVTWLKERLAMELRSLAYRIKRVEEQIDYCETMIHACDHIDRIIKIIRRSETPEESLVKALKIQPHQAKWICDLQLRKISKLDENQYKAKLKEHQALRKQLLLWQKKPRSKVLLDLERVKELVIKDRAFQVKQDEQELKVV